LIENGPDKAAEFSGDGRDRNVSVFTLVEVPELFVETVLGFEGNGDNSRWLTLSAPVEDEVSASSMAVVPGSFDQESSDVGVTGFGNGSPMFFIAGRVLRGNESEVGHESSGGSEASDIIDLTQKS
jgi:hypothetical protein